MISWITRPAENFSSLNCARVLLLLPAYMMRPSPRAPIPDRNADHFADADS